MSIRLIHGDCRDVLPTLPAESVHCCVTSPPYWGLRDYGTAQWDGGDPACDHRRFNGYVSGLDGGTEAQDIGKLFKDNCGKCGAIRIDRQIGLEPTPDVYVATLVEVFRDVRRVLRKDGTCWINLGDSYATNVNGRSAADTKALGNDDRTFRDKPFSTVGNGLKPKDLCGIPWRVAFALQAPDYLGSIRRETDRAWLAALTDGEGCITILEATSPHGSGSSYPPILQVRMCDRECIDKAMSLVGSNGDNPAQYPASMEGQRPAYQWRIHGRKAADTIAEIYPWLLIKRKQAIVAWNHQFVRDSYETKRGVKIPTDALEKQKLCRDLIQRLNKREAADLPSWMIEPPQPFGPGWYLRSDVIWAKPNPMPESVTDRPTKAHEYLFLLAKSERYYYDAAAIAEQFADDRMGNPNGGGAYSIGSGRNDSGALKTGLWNTDGNRTTRNRRSVWTVATQPFSEAHFATFPPALIEPCILAGSPPGGTVLDPFGGAGTTGLVADRLQRNAVLIELNPKYSDMAERRIVDDGPLFADVAAIRRTPELI